MTLQRTVLALALAGGLLPVPAAAQAPPPSWLGATFERPAAELRETLGDPVLVTRLPQAAAGAGITLPPGMPPERKARYVLALDDPLFLIVSERHGIVVGIEAFSSQPLTGEQSAVAPDPSGVRLGATEAALRAAHPDVVRMDALGTTSLFRNVTSRYVARYRLESGRVTAISWYARSESDPSTDGPALTEPTGDMPETAILDVQKTETDGIRWERIWQLFHPCDGTTQWTKSSVATSQKGARRYDAVALNCPTTGATRIVYFDITAFFGKF